VGEDLLDLTYYQSLFNEDNTEIRCRKVLDEISPAIKPLFQRFIELGFRLLMNT
jgi:5-methylcytosine-specific restriction enzyme B